MSDKKKNPSLESVEDAPKSEKAPEKKAKRKPIVVVTHGKRFKVPYSEDFSLEKWLRERYPGEYKK